MAIDRATAKLVATIFEMVDLMCIPSTCRQELVGRGDGADASLWARAGQTPRTREAGGVSVSRLRSPVESVHALHPLARIARPARHGRLPPRARLRQRGGA